MTTARKIIAGSERAAPSAARVGAPDPREQAEVSVYLRRSAAGERVTRTNLRKRREAEMKAGFDRLEAFASSHDLEVVERHAGRGLVRLAGSITALEAAFGTRLDLSTAPAGRFAPAPARCRLPTRSPT